MIEVMLLRFELRLNVSQTLTARQLALKHTDKLIPPASLA